MDATTASASRQAEHFAYRLKANPNATVLLCQDSAGVSVAEQLYGEHVVAILTTVRDDLSYIAKRSVTMLPSVGGGFVEAIGAVLSGFGCRVRFFNIGKLAAMTPGKPTISRAIPVGWSLTRAVTEWSGLEPLRIAMAEVLEAFKATNGHDKEGAEKPGAGADLFVAKDQRIAASQLPNAVVVLHAFERGQTIDDPIKVRLTKKWNADGTVSDYDNAYTYRAEVAVFNSSAEFEALLRYVKNQPDACIVRGALIPGCHPDHVHRRSDASAHDVVYFVDVPRIWFAVDIDGYKGPDFPAARALFPPELREAEMVLQYSASHGHPTKAGQLRFHAWFMLPTPLGSVELKRWLKSLDWPDDWRNSPKGNILDLGLSDAARPHYTADPVLEAGVVDPITERIIHIDGAAIATPVVPEAPARGSRGRSRGEGGSYDGTGVCFEGPFTDAMIEDGEKLLEDGLAELEGAEPKSGRGDKAHHLGLVIGVLVRAGLIDTDDAESRLSVLINDLKSNCLHSFRNGVRRSDGRHQAYIAKIDIAGAAKAAGVKFGTGATGSCEPPPWEKQAGPQSFEDFLKEQDDWKAKLDKAGPVIAAALLEMAEILASRKRAAEKARPARLRLLKRIEVYCQLGATDRAKLEHIYLSIKGLAGASDAECAVTEDNLMVGRLVIGFIAVKDMKFSAAEREAERLARAAKGKTSEHFYSWGAFTMTADGLVVEFEKGSGGNVEVILIPVSSAFEILGVTRSVVGDGWGLWLRWTDADGGEHTQLVSSGLIHGDAKALCTMLAEGGLWVNSGAQDAFKKYLGGVRDVKGRVTVAKRTGWLELSNGERAFVLPHGTVKSEDAEEIVLDAHAYASYSQRGTLEDWQKGVGTLAASHEAAVFFVSVGFAGPLLELAGMDGVAVHGFGDTTIGKSTLAAMSTSVWGRGSVTGGFIRTWRATANGLEGAAVGSTDTLLALDEIGQLELKEAYGSIYMLANGSGKSRANRDGSARDPATWRVMVVSTGEMPFKQKLAEDRTKKSKGGQHVRMLDVPVDRGLGFGVFNNTGEFAEAGKLSDACRAAAVTAYGTAGPAFVQALIDGGIDGDVVKKRMDAWLLANVKGAIGEVQRVAKVFALIGVAGELAAELKIAPWDAGKAASAALWAAKAWGDERGGFGAMDEMTALAHVRQIIETYGESRFKEMDKELKFPGQPTEDGFAPPIMYGYRKGVGDDREWYVLEETWKSIFCEGQNPAIVIKTLRKVGALKTDPDGKHVKVKTRLGKDGTKRVYVITTKIIESKD